MIIRQYNPERDLAAAQRIWLECGWLDRGRTEPLGPYLAESRAWVAELHGEAECLVTTSPGSILHLREDLPLSCVTCVTTSRIARRQGLASRTLARALQADAAAGELVSALGMFEQGFYDQLGFGTGAYEHWAHFDPAALRLRVRPRIPVRLTREHAGEMHACRMRRLRRHGAVSLHRASETGAETEWSSDGFGLGYRDPDSGELTHCLWASAKDAEDGPYRISFLAYRSSGQLLELLALIRSWGEQVRQVTLAEPPGIQLQDLLVQPLKRRQIAEKARFEFGIHAIACFQYRMLDLAGCLARTHLPGPGVAFNLEVEDAAERFLPEEAGWRGIGGEWRVELGPESGARRGSSPGLPALRASAGAFTRLWMGVASASALAATDDLEGPGALLAALDEAVRLPVPRPDWDF